MVRYTLDLYVPTEWIVKNGIVQESWKTNTNIFLKMRDSLIWMPSGVEESLFTGLN